MTRPALLLLVHRIPYPPNKGDKIRSYHLLRHLAGRYRVFLGAFVDDPDDLAFVGELEQLCEQVFLRELPSLPGRVRSLRGLVTGQPLTLPYYSDRRMAEWVNRLVEEQDIERAVVFSGAMAQYLMDEAHQDIRRVIDYVDVDSDKWMQYSSQRAWPMSWLYRREAKRLLCFERKVAASFDAGLFVSPAEAALFRRLAPRTADKVSHANNGVDLEYFDPQREYPNPYPEHVVPLVFTGAMDYWPNVDAVQWFAREVLPCIREAVPAVLFYIVGGNPAPTVRALSDLEGVEVTGRVPDVRDWLQHARVAVAPLRVARGVQNKVLEALAMARPTVVTPAALEGIEAVSGESLLLAESEAAFCEAVVGLLNRPEHGRALGEAGRELMRQGYHWETNLKVVSELLETGKTARGADV